MTAWVSSSGSPTFLRYKKPTSNNACRRSSRKADLVAGSFASERSRMGIESNDILTAGYSNYNVDGEGRRAKKHLEPSYE